MKQRRVIEWWHPAVLMAGLFLLPGITYAAGPVMAAWIPWWAEEAGVERAIEHMHEFTVLYPFVYEVQTDGSLRNRVDFDAEHWEALFDEADDERVDIIPTVMWFDGPAIHAVLSDTDAREAHIEEIVDMVREHRFAGVNIDYESKLAETKDYFSDFLEELEDALGRRDLTCTIEARTPPEARWREVPELIQYANDYQAFDRHCDWVEIMAYDQQRADWRLNEQRQGVPYAPVADSDWVEKVLKLALEDIDADKIMLGIATYGRAWDVTVAADWYRDYKSVASLNHPRILELADKYDAPIGRTAGGEAVITYFPQDSAWRLLNQLPTPADTPPGFEAAAKALLVATYADVEIPVRVVFWSDAQAIEEKLELVDRYNLRGAALFKVDGEDDEAMWRTF